MQRVAGSDGVGHLREHMAAKLMLDPSIATGGRHRQFPGFGFAARQDRARRLQLVDNAERQRAGRAVIFAGEDELAGDLKRQLRATTAPADTG